MKVKRTVTIFLPKDPNWLTTKAFRHVQLGLLEPCYNIKKLLGARALQHECDGSVKGKLRAEVTIWAIQKARVLLLVRHQGRVKNVRSNNKLSSLTGVNRKRIKYRRPEELLYILFNLVQIDSFPLTKHNGKLVRGAAVTKRVLEPKFSYGN